jgi:FkbM family methyltransferase
MKSTNFIYKVLMEYRSGALGTDFEVEFRGLRLTAQGGDITILPSLIDESFEELELDIFEKMCKRYEDLLVLDVGANIGIYSLIAGRSIRENSRVIAFEPDPENIRRFKHNVQKHAFTNIELVEAAVGNNSKVRIKTHMYGGVSRVAKSSEAADLVVSSLSLDDFVSQQKKPSKNYILKIDIEGFEPTVIRNSKSFIENCAPSIFLELSFGQDRASLDQWNEDLGWLINRYSYAYIITNRKMLELTPKYLLQISNSEKLHTLILSDSSIELP